MRIQSIKFFGGILFCYLFSMTLFAQDRSKEVVETILHGQPYDRDRAIEECPEIGKSIVPDLIRGLNSPKNDYIQKSLLDRALYQTLKEEKNRDSHFLESLNALASKSQYWEARPGIDALSEFVGNNDAGEMLRVIIQNHPNEEARQHAVKAFVKVMGGTTETQSFLKRLLTDNPPLVEAAAASELGEQKMPDGYSVALEILANSDKRQDKRIAQLTKESAIKALGAIGNRQALPLLMPFVQKANHASYREMGAYGYGIASLASDSIMMIEFKEMPAR